MRQWTGLRVPPIARWVGGKVRQVPALWDHLPPPPWHLIEGFCGMASLYASLPQELVGSALLNDINGDLINLFGTIALHSDQFLEELALFPAGCEEIYDALVAEYNTPECWNGLTGVQRAVRYYWMLSLGYSGNKFPGSYLGAFEYRLDHSAVRSRSPHKIKEHIRHYSAIYAKAELKQSDALELLADPRYDSPRLMIYLDPPYLGTKRGMYGLPRKIDREWIGDLLVLCAKLKGTRVILSIDLDGITDLVSKYLGDWHVFPLNTTMTSGHGAQRVSGEAILRNYSTGESEDPIQRWIE